LENRRKKNAKNNKVGELGKNWMVTFQDGGRRRSKGGSRPAG
jgi:hypothetical protein